MKDYVLGFYIEEILHERSMEESLVEKWTNLDIKYE